jgi:hypothetical protein
MRAKAQLILGGVAVAVVAIYVAGMYLAHRPPEDGRDILTTDGSEGVDSFQIESGTGEVLWRVETSPARPLSHLHYGEVPAGFRQVIPASGSPRPFRKGETLKTQVLTPTRRFTHSGEALDEGRFLGGVWESGPRKRQSAGP